MALPSRVISPMKRQFVASHTTGQNEIPCITTQFGYKHTFCQNFLSTTHLLVPAFTYLLTYLLTYLITYLITYLLTARSRVFLEKVRGFQLVKKFSTVYRTRRFITAVTSARHLSLSRASSIHSITKVSVQVRGLFFDFPNMILFTVRSC